MCRILITGKNGQLGHNLCQLFGTKANVYSFDKQQLDITNETKIKSMFKEIKPQIVLNAAAYTLVEKAEINKSECYNVNSKSLDFLGLYGKYYNSIIIHFSTDYIFDGTKSIYSENDIPNPLNYYGQCKLEGERKLINSGVKNLIFRTSWVSGKNGSNFVKKILTFFKLNSNFEVVCDQFGIPTSTEFLSNTIYQILNVYFKNLSSLPLGIYNLCPHGKTNWYELAVFVCRVFNRIQNNYFFDETNIRPVFSENYNSNVIRPKNSCLSNIKLEKKFNLNLPSWEIGIENLVKDILL